MLIWIDGGVNDFSGVLGQQVVDALTELGEAGYKARHAVACARDLAKYLSGLDVLSPRARAYFLRVYGEYTQLGHVFSNVDHVVASQSVLSPINLANIWRVPLQLFSREEYTEELTVVCENDTDYDIYLAMAKVWMSWNIPGCVVSSRSRAGHGSSTVSVLTRLAVEPNPSHLCLVDSDRKIPHGGEGSTARSVRSAWLGSWRSFLYVLDRRELENVLPLASVRRYLQARSRAPDAIDDFHKVHVDIGGYACLKSGESACRFHGVTRAQEGYVRVRQALSETSRVHSRFNACGEECGDCCCNIIPMLGDRFLQSFAQWLDEVGFNRVFSENDDWCADAISAAELLATKGIALPRRQ